MDPRHRILTLHTANLVGQAEIAERVGVSRHIVYRWAATDPRFPEPLARLGSKKQCAVYLWPDVEAWMKKARITGRRRRPRADAAPATP